MPSFIPGTLEENLVFGVPHGDPDGRSARVLAICRRLQLAEDVLQHMHEVHPWADVLSQTQCQLVSLARALIANPEVLCLHKPVMVFSDSTAHLLVRALREFVDSRGFEQDPSERHLRRLRTCVMTTSSNAAMELADATFHVSLTEGIRKIVDQSSDAAERNR